MKITAQEKAKTEIIQEWINIMRTTSEIVVLFWEDNQPVGMLHQNGQTNFYRVSRASKEHVTELLGANITEKKDE